MVFPLLEGFVRLVVGIAIVETRDVANGDSTAIEVIYEAAALGV